jgi:hypothetical protein
MKIWSDAIISIAVSATSADWHVLSHNTLLYVENIVTRSERLHALSKSEVVSVIHISGTTALSHVSALT